MRWVTASTRPRLARNICRTDSFSMEIFRTGEVRIGDSIHELSEYAEFILYRGRILLTLDKGMVIYYRVDLNPVWKALALRFLWRMRKRVTQTSRVPPPRFRHE